MFASRYVCVQGIAVTDGVDIASSKVLCKLKVGAILEGLGESQDVSGIGPRVKCKVASSGEEGLVTLKGNQGTQYLGEVTAYSVYCKELDSTMSTIEKSNSKIKEF